VKPQIEQVEVIGAMSTIHKHLVDNANFDVKSKIKKELHFRLMEEFFKYLEERIDPKHRHYYSLYNITEETIDHDKRAMEEGHYYTDYFTQHGIMEYRLRAKIGFVYGG
jgi:hypothetical protein